jgi:hypothetical protein
MPGHDQVFCVCRVPWHHLLAATGTDGWAPLPIKAHADARGSKTDWCGGPGGVDDWKDASKRRAGLAHDTSQATQNLHFF